MINPELRAPSKAESSSTDGDAEGPVCLRLYIAGITPNSQRAVANLKSALQEFAGERRFGVEYVDVLVDTKRAAADSIIITPTLIGVGSRSRLVIIGDLSDTKRLKAFLMGAASFD